MRCLSGGFCMNISQRFVLEYEDQFQRDYGFFRSESPLRSLICSLFHVEALALPGLPRQNTCFVRRTPAGGNPLSCSLN